MSRNASANGSRRATSRTATWEGALKLPGTCIAIHAPAGSVLAQPTSNSACSGTHCSAAFEITTSVSGLGDHSAMVPTTASRPRSRAAATISCELSTASTTASGHRCESVTVRLPGPQPRSTTRRGDSAATRAVRSKNGRPRWSAKARYTSGFHMLSSCLTMEESAAVRGSWESLGLPGLVDVHTHFMPKRVMDKVWQYFDTAGALVGRPWPVRYRTDEAERLETLRGFGVRAFTSLVYPHKPQMAAWLNRWAAQFAAETPDCLSTATFYPEPGAAEYVTAAVAGGVRVFKAHVQVGGYDPTDPLLDDVWGVLEDARTPIIIHCGSGPQPGVHTGPEPVRALLGRHPRLRLV